MTGTDNTTANPELLKAIQEGMGQETPLMDDALTLPANVDGDEEDDADDKAGAADDADKDKDGEEAGGDDDDGIDANKDKPATADKKTQEGDKPAAAEVSDEEFVKNLSEKSRERFQNLTTALKTKDDELVQTRSQLEQFGQVLVDHHIDKSAFNSMLQYNKALATNDVATAKKLLNEQIRNFALATGQQISLDEADPLADFPDLRQKVTDMDMTEDVAMEMAKFRSKEIRAAKLQQEQNSQSNASDQQQVAINQAITGIDAWSKGMATKHLEWPLIEGKLNAHLERIVSTTPPNTWLTQLQTAAELLVTNAPVKLKNKQPGALISNGGGGGTKEPKTALAAVMGALGQDS